VCTVATRDHSRRSLAKGRGSSVRRIDVFVETSSTSVTATVATQGADDGRSPDLNDQPTQYRHSVENFHDSKCSKQSSESDASTFVAGNAENQTRCRPTEDPEVAVPSAQQRTHDHPTESCRDQGLRSSESSFSSDGSWCHHRWNCRWCGGRCCHHRNRCCRCSPWCSGRSDDRSPNHTDQGRQSHLRHQASCSPFSKQERSGATWQPDHPARQQGPVRWQCQPSLIN
jgi:hypothetical protein